MTINDGDVLELLERYRSSYPKDYRARLEAEVRIARARLEMFTGALIKDAEDYDGGDDVA